jgi:TolB-like protein/DNA-binding winged helix-turn-helix (wHTH) protein
MNTSSRNASFGPYSLDVRSGELKKFGTRVKIGEQAFQILCSLLDAPGELVTREELRARLWAGDTFVDFDHGLNSAVQRLRDCLSDSAISPRWIETVPRRGYRFVGKVEWSEESANGENFLNSANAMPDEVSHYDSGASAAATVSSKGYQFVAPVNLEEKPATSTVLPSAGRDLRRISPRLAIAAALLLTAAAITYTFRSHFVTGGSHIQSIAVLPLVNLSGDKSQDYFADGMTDELITALAKNRALRVVSRTSAMHYKGVQRPVREIARELGVDGVLEGSVSRTSNRIHMTVQLIYAPTDSHVWAESYDRDLNQAISLPEELSQTVAKEVKTATSPTMAPRHINPEAHDAYLRGRYFWFAHNIPQTLSYFEKAIQLQPDYAAAWAGLSDTYALLGVFGGGPPKESLANARDAARKAVELDDSLGETHLSMAGWYLWSWNPLQADAESRRAIELNPTYAESHFFRHLILLALNRREEALQEEKRAVELDPFARTYGLGACYIALRQFDAAIDELRMQSQLHPNDSTVHESLSEAYWYKGMYNESQDELEKAFRLSGRTEFAAAVHRAFEQGGEKAVVQWEIETVKGAAHKGHVSPYDVAVVIAFSGDKEETLKYLEAAYREHIPLLVAIQTEINFNFLHRDSRYRALVQKIGLAPAYED